MGDTEWDYRYASTMGDRYAFPVYFKTREDAEIYKRICARYLGGLPGHDSMRVEERQGDEWCHTQQPRSESACRYPPTT